MFYETCNFFLKIEIIQFEKCIVTRSNRFFGIFRRQNPENYSVHIKIE